MPEFGAEWKKNGKNINAIDIIYDNETFWTAD